MNDKYALLIGINYIGSAYQLRGCINDAINMKRCLRNLGYRKIVVLTDNTRIKPTKSNIIRELLKMVSLRDKYSELFFHYAGHGTTIHDSEGDETDYRDEVIIPVDYYENGYISDDFINSCLRKIKGNKRLTMLFDCCHSGTIADIQFQTKIPGLFNIESDHVIPANIIMYSGCKDTQQSADAYNISNQGKWSGAMTSSFINATRGKKHVGIGCFEILENMRNFIKNKGYTQIPQLSSTKRFNSEISLIGKSAASLINTRKRRRKSRLERMRERLRKRLRKRRERRERMERLRRQK